MITLQNHPVIWCLVAGFMMAAMVVIRALRNAPLMDEYEMDEYDLPASPGLRPGDAERSALLPHKLDPVTPDRPMYFDSATDRISFALAAGRKAAYKQWLADVAEEIDEMVGKVREGGI